MVGNLRRHPHYLEINTRVWLWELGKKYRKNITLALVPDEEWDNLAQLGFDLIWLMGIWSVSTIGREQKALATELQQAYSRALPDWTKQDVIGSPFAIADYRLNPLIGTQEDLSVTRAKLHQRDLRLIVDFVPNHLAIDHPWLTERPDYFISAQNAEAAQYPGYFFPVIDREHVHYIAHGKDPHFPPWTDTAQLDYAKSSTRQAMIETLLNIARTSDGVRCDMAMLCLNDVHHRTWAFLESRASIHMPPTEFWTEAVSAIKDEEPGFIFVAEVYWDREWEMQQLGFDFTYDKTLYDRLRWERDTASIRSHLRADSDYQNRSLRFIENHDEERALTAFGSDRIGAASVLISTIPGARFFHQGQMEGLRTRLPVQLGRRREDPEEPELSAYIRRCLEIAHGTLFHEGQWTLLEGKPAWPDNDTYQHCLTWQWIYGTELVVIAINWSNLQIQARIRLQSKPFGHTNVRIHDLLTHRFFYSSGQEIDELGLFIDLGPYQAQVLSLSE
ncbi:hypothetical protein JXQ70_13245 [bacterium]|nr:hypothetical protein [bacterium]